jgi:hypothetical protein
VPLSGLRQAQPAFADYCRHTRWRRTNRHRLKRDVADQLKLDTVHIRNLPCLLAHQDLRCRVIHVVFAYQQPKLFESANVFWEHGTASASSSAEILATERLWTVPTYTLLLIWVLQS